MAPPGRGAVSGSIVSNVGGLALAPYYVGGFIVKLVSTVLQVLPFSLEAVEPSFQKLALEGQGSQISGFWTPAGSITL